MGKDFSKEALDILGRDGYVVESVDPLVINHTSGGTATGEIARIIVDTVLKNAKPMPVSTVMSGEDDLMYAVMKLQSVVTVKDVSGDEVEVAVTGAKGFIPVYDSREKAMEASCGGKYSVTVLKLG